MEAKHTQDPQGAKDTKDTKAPEQPDDNRKSQLRARVEQRLSELQAALSRPTSSTMSRSWAQNIQDAIATAQASLSGGWEHVGEVEAAQLSRWLETTENVGVTPPHTPESAPAGQA